MFLKKDAVVTKLIENARIYLQKKYLYDTMFCVNNNTAIRGIAQQVEQRSPKPRVVSSILTAPAKYLAWQDIKKALKPHGFKAFFD